jgi:hypothetical protein
MHITGAAAKEVDQVSPLNRCQRTSFYRLPRFNGTTRYSLPMRPAQFSYDYVGKPRRQATKLNHVRHRRILFD